ncbi:hypothetical protein [Polaromonas sp. SM01]|uniref:DUF6630 family protein n=1 Tax=Polaromonas sp. SM01 TaxID=3085630 RepID=UPI002982B132|nr:hypothetical protein [Polaromonas sp. SM01]MDW5441890.1 hypothetical protein [Polaromonas sp. SM01]
MVLVQKKKKKPEVSPSAYHNMFGKDYDKMLPDPADIESISKGETDEIEEMSEQEREQILDRRRRLEALTVALLKAVNIPEIKHQQLVDLVINQFGNGEDSDEISALMDALHRDSPIVERVFCFIDWKASDEIAWQIAELAPRIGLPWEKGSSLFDGDSTDDVLMAIGDWLGERGFFLLVFQTGGDDCLFTVVPGSSTELLALASQANLIAKSVNSTNGAL